MLNETFKGLLLLWNYRFNLLIESISIVVVFIGLNFFVGNGELQAERLDSSLIGYIIWIYTFMAISNMGWSLKEEAQTGTLEQMYMSPTPPELLILGRTLANFITTSIMIGLVTLILIPLFGISLPLRLEGVVVFAWTIFGLLGLGLMVGGATLVFKHVESLSYFIQYGLMFLNGSLVAITSFPAWLEIFARLLPGTQGIFTLRQALIEQQSFADLWGSLLLLMLHSTVYFGLGWGVYKLGERYARRHGTLGQY
jgi:ABC-2 type transport system permease protein